MLGNIKMNLMMLCTNIYIVYQLTYNSKKQQKMQNKFAAVILCIIELQIKLFKEHIGYNKILILKSCYKFEIRPFNLNNKNLF
jgi:hypothetical protein